MAAMWTDATESGAGSTDAWRGLGTSAPRLVWMALLVACAGGPEKEDSAGGGETTDDSGTGGGGIVWSAAGEGKAYFYDGRLDNSLFHLELSRVVPAEAGTGYYGWVSKGGRDPIETGEIVVTGEDLTFEAELRVDALLEGYDTFDAWATDNGGTAQEGVHLWSGSIDPLVYDVIQKLAIASEETPDGQGSLRSLETQVEALAAYAQAAVDEEGADVDALHEVGEAMSNSMQGELEDVDGDGNVATFSDAPGLINDGGSLELILADFSVFADVYTPDDIEREYARLAYTCVQRVEEFVDDAARSAATVTACGAESSCDGLLENAIELLDYAQNGEDVDESGEVDIDEEGTIECAVTYIAEVASIPVSTP